MSELVGGIRGLNEVLQRIKSIAYIILLFQITSITYTFTNLLSAKPNHYKSDNPSAIETQSDCFHSVNEVLHLWVHLSIFYTTIET